MSARDVAARVLVRVWEDDAFAAPALSSELERANLDSRDRGLATELTYGVLRTQKYLETRLEKFGRLKKGERTLVAHLLVCVYQLEFLDRVPARAAVSEALALISPNHDRRVTGFANAVLRRLSEDEQGRRPLSDAIFASAPSWLRKRLVRQLGEVEVRELLARDAKRAPHLRVVGSPSNEFEDWLQTHAEALEAVPRAYRFVAGGDPRRSDFYRDGAFIVQELGAQLIGHCLGANEGESVLDVCAGRGQKTSLLAEIVGPGGRVVATDLFEHKVRALGEEMTRLGLSVEGYQWDWTTPPPPQLEGVFDRVLVDAPCTGVGTLARRPEIARRLTPEDPARMARLQLEITTNAARCLRPGGTLLLSTCSVFEEEGPSVVRQLEEVGLRPVPVEAVPAVATPFGPEGALLRLSPGRSETDGYFIAWLEK